MSKQKRQTVSTPRAGSWFQRWLEQNRAYGEAIERYAHPGTKR